MFRSFGPYHLARLNAARRRHDVLALECFDVDAEYDWRVSEQKQAAGVIALSKSPRLGTFGRFDLAKKLKNELTQFGPSAVAIPGYSEAFAMTALGVCRSLGIRTILMSDTHRRSARRSPIRGAIKRNVVSLFNAAFVAGSLHADYLTRLGFPSDRIAMGYDVVDNSHFAPSTEKLRPSPVNAPRPYFFCCARLVQKKNLALLIEAFVRYRKVSPAHDWNLVIAGDGPLGTALERQKSATAFAANIHLVGRKCYDELPSYYTAAGAFILPSSVEEWGLAVNEAMAGGLPVLVSKAAGCTPDLVIHDVNGSTFDPADANELAEKMQEISVSPRRAEMGRESRRIIADWDLQRFADGLTEAVEVTRKAGIEKRSRVGSAIAALLSSRV